MRVASRRTYRTGGGSDANVLAAMGVPTLALACGMTGVHGTDEQIAVADLRGARRASARRSSRAWREAAIA